MEGFWVMVQMKKTKISVIVSGKETKQVDHRSRLAPSNLKKGRSGRRHANGKTPTVG
jgi:hypothetical protein